MRGDRKRDTKTSQKNMDCMTQAVRELLRCIGEDTTREGLQDTPKRMAKALMFLTKGYEQSIDEVVNGAVFDEPNADGMVLMKDIVISSLCEHHMLPFFGKCHIAYLPSGKVLGLSKLARICEVFARRLQVQERLTQQIASAVERATGARGVGVVIECTHMCVSMRGIEKHGALTTTSCTLGEFRENAKTRAEFLGLIK